jgi:hypothetical protein
MLSTAAWPFAVAASLLTGELRKKGPRYLIPTAILREAEQESSFPTNHRDRSATADPLTCSITLGIPRRRRL